MPQLNDADLTGATFATAKQAKPNHCQVQLILHQQTENQFNRDKYKEASPCIKGGRVTLEQVALQM